MFAVASKALDEIVVRLMSSVRDRFGYSASAPDKVGHDFRELSRFLRTLSSYESFEPRLANVQDFHSTTRQLTECLTRIQTLHPSHTSSEGASPHSNLSSTISKDEGLILSLAGQLVSRLYINQANNPRYFQKLKKALEILMSLQPETKSQVEQRIHELFVIPSSGLGMNLEDLNKVSSLLESSDFVRGFLRRNFPQVLTSVARTLCCEIKLQNKLDTDSIQPSRVPAMDACYQAAKVFLQMCKHGQEELRPLLWEPKRGNTSPSEDSSEDLHQIISGLVTLLEDKRFSKDCGLMAGSSLSMMLNSAPSPRQAAEAVTRLLNRYSAERYDGGPRNLQIGNVVIGAALFTPSTPSSLLFAQLAATRGFLTCCNKAILLVDVSPNQENQILCMNVLFPVVCDLCKTADGELKYHTSEALTLYLQAMKSLLPVLQKGSPCLRLFGPDSAHTRAILQLVWQEWQSPVDGVAEMIRSALSTLLDLHDRENKGQGSSNSQLVDSITSSLLNTAWHVKGRYHLMTSVVPHCSTVKLLTAHPSLPGELLRCQGTNYLAAAATELHNALVRRMKEEIAGMDAGGWRNGKGVEEYAEGWGSIWKEVMLQGLCSKDGLVRYHTSKYWLPSALKNFPGIFHILMKNLVNGLAMELSEEQADVSDVRNLHACIVLLKYGRANNLLESDWLVKYRENISAGLWHMEDEIQADSLSLLCCSPKKSELPSHSEMLLLRETFPHFLNSESAAFRNQLRHNMSVFVVRLCDGSLVLVKRLKKLEGVKEKSSLSHDLDNQTDGKSQKRNQTAQTESVHLAAVKEQLLGAVDFLDWLMEVCFGSFFPGACYQRKRAAMDILGVIFEGLLARDQQLKMTGRSDGVMMWAMEHGKCNLLSERNASLLLECIQDGSNDLRSSSCHFLSTYYPTALPSSSAYPYTSPSEVLCLALLLVSSPKVQESEAGSLLTKMVFYKHSVAKNLKILDEDISSPPGSPMKTNGPSTEHGTVHFVESLLTSLVYQLKCCKKNLLQAASVTPMHGLIRAIRRCLTDQPATLRRIFTSDSVNWSSLVDKLLTTLQDITHFILLILSGQDKMSDSPNVSQMAPSFGQMGEAIERLIADLAMYRIDDEDAGDGGGGGDGMMALSEEHQLILACCWLNLKECSLLLGSLAETMPLRNEDDLGILTFEQLTLMANILVEILTRCRHKGAIDSCNQGFAKLCSRLLTIPRPELQSIPKTLLDQVLRLVTNEGAGSSFTKKSAGLPLLVESIISSEPRGRERPLLAYVMMNLMGIATQPLPPNPNDRLDLPQSHALNIMMALFRCSAIGTDILRHCSQAVKLSIGGFASPCWMIRNGSMRLFGTLIARIFGQKKVQDEHSQINAMSAATFFSRYPDLREFLLEEVGKFSRRLGEEGSNKTERTMGARDAKGRGREGSSDGQRVDETNNWSRGTRDEILAEDVAEDEMLGGDASGGDEARLFLHPSLHPVLTLLSKIGPGVGSEDAQSLCVFMEPVKQLASSAIYAVRELAAHAMVPLIPRNQMLQQIVRIIDCLPSEAGSVRDYNRLHGDLLQVEKLFEAAVQSENTQQEELVTIQAKLNARTWIAGATNPCALIRALFVNVALAVTAACHVCTDSGAMQLASTMKTIVGKYFVGTPPFQIGIATLNKVMSTAHLSLMTLTSGPLTPDFLTSAQALLSSQDSDITLATLNYLQSNIGDVLGRGDSSGIQKLHNKLTNVIMDSEQETRCLEKALALWVDFGQRELAGPFLAYDWLLLWNALTGLVEGERGSGLVAAVLPAIGQLLDWMMGTIKDRKFVERWCSWMVKCSHPSQCETLRLATIKSMRIAAPTIWSQIANEHTEDKIDISLGLLNVLLRLLQDELQDIRLQAAAHVSLRLPRGAELPQFRYLHSNIAQQVLLDYVCRSFSWSSRFMTSMLNLLRGSVGISETIHQQRLISGGTHLFEQESANIYAEGVVEARNLYQALVDTLEREQTASPECFKDWMTSWYEEPSLLLTAWEELGNSQNILETCILFGGTLYGVSSHSRPYQAIYTQLLYIRFLCMAAKKVEINAQTVEVISGLQLIIQQILEMPSVHPCLKTELSSLAQFMAN